MKRDIIALYEEDFGKIDDSGRAKALYDAIPAQLSRNTSRYQVGNAIPDEKVERVINIVKDMRDSMTTHIAYHSDDPNAGLALTMNVEYFKMYTSDTGLFITLAFKDADITENVIYDKHKISPIEVKSSGYKSHKSLDEFCVKFSDRINNKYVIYTKDYKREEGIDYLPVYMTMFL